MLVQSTMLLGIVFFSYLICSYLIASFSSIKLSLKVKNDIQFLILCSVPNTIQNFKITWKIFVLFVILIKKPIFIQFC